MSRQIRILIAMAAVATALAASACHKPQVNTAATDQSGMSEKQKERAQQRREKRFERQALRHIAREGRRALR